MHLENCSLKCARHLVSPRFGEPFCLYTDASQFAFGCCLAQADESGAEFPIAFDRFASPLECC